MSFCKPFRGKHCRDRKFRTILQVNVSVNISAVVLVILKMRQKMGKKVPLVSVYRQLFLSPCFVLRCQF